MKILHILKSVNPAEGGVVEVASKLSAVLAKSGWEHEFVTLDRPSDPWVKSCPIKVHATNIDTPAYAWLQPRIPWLRYGFNPHLAPWLAKNADRFDAIVVNGLWNFTAMAARLVLPKQKVPYIVFTHGMIDPWFRQAYPIKNLAKQLVWWLVEGPLLRHARHVVFLAEEERLLARNAFWPYRINEAVVGNGTVSPDASPADQETAFADQFPGLKGKRFVMFLSRIHRKKGCDLLLRAFAETLHLEPDVELVMAGPGEQDLLDELKKLADELGIAPKVHWLGMVSGEAKWGAFRSCEAFVLPSHSENFGAVIAEAMACAKPVLITNKINIWREVEASGGGYADDDTVEGVVSLLKRFYSLSTAQKQQMGLAARQGFERYFDLTKTAMTFKNLLESEVKSNLKSVRERLVD